DFVNRLTGLPRLVVIDTVNISADAQAKLTVGLTSRMFLRSIPPGFGGAATGGAAGGTAGATTTTTPGGGGGGSTTTTAAGGGRTPPTAAGASGAAAGAASGTASGGGTAAGGSPAPRRSQRVSLLDVFQEGGRTLANVKVNDTVYKLGAGDPFGGSYKVVSL